MWCAVKRCSNSARIRSRSSAPIFPTASTACGSFSTMNPVTPFSSTSGTDPLLYAITGVPQAMASIIQTERLAPRDRKQQGGGIAQKFAFLTLADFADEFDVALRQQRLDRGPVVFPIDLVDLGRYLERHAGLRGNSDGRIRSFFR